MANITTRGAPSPNLEERGLLVSAVNSAVRIGGSMITLEVLSKRNSIVSTISGGLGLCSDHDDHVVFSGAAGSSRDLGLENF